MGQGFYVDADNKIGRVLKGTVLEEHCFYHADNLHEIQEGFSQSYIEFKNSGGCWLNSKRLVMGFRLPTTPEDRHNLAFVVSSREYKLPEKWSVQYRKCDGNHVYLGTIPGEIQARLDDVRDCNDQTCITLTILPSTGGTTEGQALVLENPEDGSDYQGPPKDVLRT